MSTPASSTTGGAKRNGLPASLFGGNDGDSSHTSSLNSSLRSSMEASLAADSADGESMASSLGMSPSTRGDLSATSADSTRSGDETEEDEADANPAAHHPLISRFLRHRRKDVRSKKVARELKKKKARLDEMYAAARQSYFNKSCEAHFSIVNEFQCLWGVVVRFFLTLEEERLPWLTDFADPKKMRFPHKMKDVTLRLNLNIAYYASNYLEIFYAITLPFLLIYNPMFLALLLICCFLVHDASARRRVENEYGDAVTILGRSMPYRRVGHIVVALVVIAVFFFSGIQTLLALAFLNGIVIIPHAIWRRPTFFDDEEMEKCRPKLVQYILTVVFALLAYLEGDTHNKEDCAFHLAQRRRAKLGLRVLKLEDDPYIHP